MDNIRKINVSVILKLVDKLNHNSHNNLINFSVDYKKSK